MLIDARTLSAGTSLEADICIIGAGAAGLTLAREFNGRGPRVVILESGGLVFDGPTQALYDGDNVGLPYFPLNESRLRYFGGTTNHWSGFCRPLDPLDFETRDWVPHSGWPIGRSDLDPFYRRAHPILDLGEFRYDAAFWESPGSTRLPLDGTRFVTTIFQRSAPTRFGNKFREEVETSRNVSCYLNANVTSVQTDDTRQNVHTAQVRCLNGPAFSVTARHFILATGGVENARLLLAWKLGNAHDWVGRCFMEHIHLESGLWMPVDAWRKLPFYETHWDNRAKFFPALTLTEETVRAEKLAAFGVALTPLVLGNRRAVPYIPRDMDEGESAPKMIQNVAGLVQSATPIPPDTVSSCRFFSLYNRTEQTPNPDSRLTLTSKTDALGLPVVQLNWRIHELDRRSIRRAHELLAADIGRAGLGRMRIDFEGDDDATWPRIPKGGRHHIGTTRMSADPVNGVVDAQCKVHGMSNFYVAGSSVFPTCGFSNPTLTIVALAIRLADHLKEQLK